MRNAALNLSPPILQFNPFDTPESRPDILLTGGLSGNLGRQGPCIIVDSLTGKLAPLWPVGTKLSSLGKSYAIELPDQRGRALIGGVVHLSGSTLRADEEHRLLKSVGQSCPGPYFLVSRVEQKNN